MKIFLISYQTELCMCNNFAFRLRTIGMMCIFYLYSCQSNKTPTISTDALLFQLENCQNLSNFNNHLNQKIIERALAVEYFDKRIETLTQTTIIKQNLSGYSSKYYELYNRLNAIRGALNRNDFNSLTNLDNWTNEIEVYWHNIQSEELLTFLKNEKIEISLEPKKANENSNIETKIHNYLNNVQEYLTLENILVNMNFEHAMLLQIMYPTKNIEPYN